MARKIKWRLQFKSLNGTGCLVNIYEEDYIGSQADTTKTGANVPFAVETGVTELTGADMPFVFEEDDSSDLLEFIRIKTGAIRVIETTYGALDNLMPKSITHHFVEAFYGTERVFTGYMQSQEFDNAWVAEPRILEFPVVSPLGLLDAFNFSVPETHELVTLGSLMHEVMCGLNPAANSTTDSDYANVINPSITADYEPWNFVVNSTVIVPLNPDFQHYDFEGYDQVEGLWAPKSYKFFIEGICKCFGWMVHDTPTSIVFAKYDYSGQYYSQLTVNGLLTFRNTEFRYIGLQTPSFNQYFSNADDNAEMSVVRPLKELILNTGNGDIEKKELATKYSISRWTPAGLGNENTFVAIPLTQVGPNVSGSYIGEASIDTGGNVYYPGLFPLAYAKVEIGDRQYHLDESWVIKYNEAWEDSASNPIITAMFFGNPPRNIDGWSLLKLKVEYGSTLQDMHSSGFNDFGLWLVVRVGDRYYDIAADTYRDYIAYNAIVISGADGKVVPRIPSNYGFHDANDVDGIFINLGYKVLGGVEISLLPKTDGPDNNSIIRITEMSLNNPLTESIPYFRQYHYYDHIKLGNNQTGTDTIELDVEFNNYDVIMSEKSIGSSDGVPRGNYPTYPYMFKPLHVLTQKVKKIANADGQEYGNDWTYWIFGWRWRMIAKNFNLRDDEFTVTLARSSTIEQQ